MWLLGMRSRELDLKRYDTDKEASGYLLRYDAILGHLVDREVKLLELGINTGGSLLFWRDYFPRGTVVGVDLRLPDGLAGAERIHVFQGSQGDTRFLSEVANKTAPKGFDVIIDDASHVGRLTQIAFWHLFDNHLKPGGIYAIEDWGTGYWHDWPDGRALRQPSRLRSFWHRVSSRHFLGAKARWPSHAYGMVGFLKELVDEQGVADALRRGKKGVASGRSKFESMLIAPGIAFITKNSP